MNYHNLQPQHWWNEHEHPTVSFGPFAFPAPIIPYTFAFAFIFWKTYPGRRRRDLDGARRQEPPPVVPEQLAHGMAIPIAAPDLETRAAQVLFCFHGTISARAMYMTSVHDPTSKDPFTPDLGMLCLAEVAALLLGGFGFGGPDERWPAALTSLGWLVFRYSDYESWYDLALVVALAVPCVWAMLGTVGHGAKLSGLLLVVLVVDATIPPTSSIREWKVLWTVELWRPGLIFATQAIHFLVDLISAPPQSERRSLSGYTAYFAEAITAELGDIGRELISILTFLAMLALSVCFTGFLNACLGWSPLLVSMPAKSPFQVGVAIIAGGMVFPIPWALLMHFRRGPRQPLSQLPPLEILLKEGPDFGEAVGWSATTLVILHFVLSRIDSGMQH